VGSSDTVTANYSGDSNHSSGSGSVSQQVNQVASSTSVSSSLNPSIYGQSISFSATVTGSSPTGTVQFYIDSTAFGSAVTLASVRNVNQHFNAGSGNAHRHSNLLG